MKTRFKEGYAVNFQISSHHLYMLNSAAEFLFGSDIGTLSKSLLYSFFIQFSLAKPMSQSSQNQQQIFSTQFSCAFADVQMVTALQSWLGCLWLLFEFWKDRIEETMKFVYSFLKPTIAEGVWKSQKETEEDNMVTLLDHLITHTQDPIIIWDEILNLTVAGQDSTTTLLTFTVYMLSQHPEVLHKLQEEIMTVIRPERWPTYNDIWDMKYLWAVLNGRIYIILVPFNMRESNKNMTLLPIKSSSKLYFIPARTRFIYTIFVIHHHIDLWGLDIGNYEVLNFNPECFLDERLYKYLTANPFIFLPFNAGPRICLGQQFTYNETLFFIIKLL
ncbi:Cytochrome P450 52E2 [Leucoagaricus sp. SymC.cos]|nr:Cytochrome P450 52E2 [Leucoagaricus sp. SymC.cos]